MSDQERTGTRGALEGLLCGALRASDFADWLTGEAADALHNHADQRALQLHSLSKVQTERGLFESFTAFAVAEIEAEKKLAAWLRLQSSRSQAA